MSVLVLVHVSSSVICMEQHTYSPDHSLCSKLMSPQQIRERVWEELQSCIKESCSGLVTELPETPPVPLWRPGPPSSGETPSYTTQQQAAVRVAEVSY